MAPTESHPVSVVFQSPEDKGARSCGARLRACCHVPIVVDLVEDRVRSRGISIAIITAVFTVVFSILFPAVLRDPMPLLREQTVNSLDLLVPPYSTIVFGDPIASVAKPIKLRFTNVKGIGLSGKGLNVTVTSGVAICHLNDPGTLAGLLDATLCQPTAPRMVGTLFNVSDIDGTLWLTDMTLLTGYPGQYIFTFSHEAPGIAPVIVTFTILFTPKVSRMAIAGTTPLITSSGANQPFSIQPSVQLWDSNGAPVAGKTVIASVPSASDLKSYGTLVNNFAVTDENGVATFSDLQLSDYDLSEQNIQFFSDGETATWSRPGTNVTLMTPGTAAINILSQTTGLTVMEGGALDSCVVVELRDAANQPVVGALAFASVSPLSPTFGKQVTNAVSAPSDATGTAVFLGLGFTLAGAVGDYTVQFSSRGFTAPMTLPVTVTTSVAYVFRGLTDSGQDTPLCTDLAGQPGTRCLACDNLNPWVFLAVQDENVFHSNTMKYPMTACGLLNDDDGSGDDSDGLQIVALDMNGFGVANKGYSIALNTTAFTVTETLFTGVTDDSGVILLPLNFFVFAANSTEYGAYANLMIAVDGVAMEPIPITLCNPYLINITTIGQGSPADEFCYHGQTPGSSDVATADQAACLSFYCNSTATRNATANCTDHCPLHPANVWLEVLAMSVSTVQLTIPPAMIAVAGAPWPPASAPATVRVTNRLGQPAPTQVICPVALIAPPGALTNIDGPFRIDPTETYIGPFSADKVFTGGDNGLCGVTDLNGVATVKSVGAHGLGFSQETPRQAVWVSFVPYFEITYYTYFGIVPRLTGAIFDAVQVSVQPAVASVNLPATNPTSAAVSTPMVFHATVYDTMGQPAVNMSVTLYVIAPDNNQGCLYFDSTENVMFLSPAGATPTQTRDCDGDDPPEWEISIGTTAADGTITWSYQFEPPAVGTYAWAIKAASVRTPYVTLKATLPAGISISILTPPSFSYNYSLGMPFGSPGYTAPVIQTTPPLAGVSIGVRCVSNNAILQNPETYTDTFGQATFDFLAILATTTATNVGLQFTYGDETDATQQVTTATVLVFVDDWLEVNVNVVNKPSFFVNRNLPFQVPIQVAITTHRFSQALLAGASNVLNFVNEPTSISALPDLSDFAGILLPLNILVGVNYHKNTDIDIIEASTPSGQLINNVMKLSNWKDGSDTAPATTTPPTYGPQLFPVAYTFGTMQFLTAPTGPAVIRFRMPGTELVYATSLTAVSALLAAVPASWPVFVSDTASSVDITAPSTTETITNAINTPIPISTSVKSRTGVGVPGQNVIPIIMSAPDGTLPELVFPTVISSDTVISRKLPTKAAKQSNVTRGDAIFTPGVRFRAGISGTYTLAFRVKDTRVISEQQLTINLTNPVESVVTSPLTVAVGGVTVGVPESLSPLRIQISPVGDLTYLHYVVVRPYLFTPDAKNASRPPKETLDKVAVLDYNKFYKVDANGILNVPVKFTDGLNQQYKLEVIVDGVIAARTANFTLNNPLRLAPDKLDQFRNYVYLVALAVIPLFLGNSAIQNGAVLIFGVLSALGSFSSYAALIGPTLKVAGVAPNGFQIFLVVVALLNILYIVVKYLIILLDMCTCRVKNYYFAWRGAMYTNLVNKLVRTHVPIPPKPKKKYMCCGPPVPPFDESWTPNPPVMPEMPTSPGKMCGYVKPYFKWWSAMRKWKKEKAKRMAINHHAEYETKGDFVYPQRLLFGVSLSVMFTIIGFMLTVVGLLWADYFLTQMGSQVDTLALKSEGFLRSPQFQAVMSLDLSAIQKDASLLAAVSDQYGADVVQAAIKAQIPDNSVPLDEQEDQVVDDNVGGFFGKMIAKFGSFTSLLTGGPSGFDETTLDSTSVDFIQQLRAFVKDLINSIRVALYISSLLAACIGFLVVCWCLWSIMSAYRRDTMLLRRGKLPYNIKNFKIDRVPNYIGFQVAHSVVAFAVAYFVLTIAIFILSWPVLLEFVWIKVRAILIASLSINLLFNILYPIVVKNFLLDYANQTIRHRRLFAIFDNIYMILGILAGLAAAVGRIVGTISTVVINFVRLDISTVPRPAEHKDPGFHSYIAMLILDHMHTNPVGSVFSYSLIAAMYIRRGEEPKHSGAAISPDNAGKVEAAEVKSSAAARLKTVRNKFWLALTLTANPSLKPYRKAALAVALEARAAKEKRLGAGLNDFDDDDDEDVMNGDREPVDEDGYEQTPVANGYLARDQSGMSARSGVRSATPSGVPAPRTGSPLPPIKKGASGGAKPRKRLHEVDYTGAHKKASPASTPTGAQAADSLERSNVSGISDGGTWGRKTGGTKGGGDVELKHRHKKGDGKKDGESSNEFESNTMSYSDEEKA